MKKLIAAAFIAASVFTGTFAGAQHNRGYQQLRQGYGNQQQPPHQQGGYGGYNNNNQQYNRPQQDYGYSNGGYNQSYNNGWAQRGGYGQGYGHRRMMRNRYDRAMCRESFAMHMVAHRGGTRRW